MSQQGTLKRYSLIIGIIRECPFVSFKRIQGFLESNGFEISKRTLQRDICSLRNEFCIEIDYVPERDGYQIRETHGFVVDSFLRFLEISTLARLLGESLSAGRKSLHHISFGTTGNLTGIELIKPLLAAVHENHWVSLSYKPFYREAQQTHRIRPHLLREYLGRWYLVATYEPGKKFYSFGLDRICDLQVLEDRFEPPADFEPAEIFARAIGIENAHGKAEVVRLAFTHRQAKYIKTLPLHQSQRIISEDSEECLVELLVIPNHELVQRILMYSGEVRVLCPEKLVEEIQDTLKRGLEMHLASSPK